MDTVDRADIAQKWLMKYYRQWIPLDACLELVHAIDEKREVVEPECCPRCHEPYEGDCGKCAVGLCQG